jgi:hypothetical protein
LARWPAPRAVHLREDSALMAERRTAEGDAQITDYPIPRSPIVRFPDSPDYRLPMITQLYNSALPS